MVNLIETKYVITNQIAQRADVYKVMYVTVPITVTKMVIFKVPSLISY